MTYPFKILVNDNFEFEFDNHNTDELNTLNLSDSSLHVLHKNKSFKATIVHSNFNQKIYHIHINGNSYKVIIKNELDQRIQEMGFSVGSSKKVNDIIAPMPGIILSVNISEGQEVKEGETLLILEAMKMENALVSHREGIVKSVHIQKGETVEKGTLLIEME